MGEVLVWLGEQIFNHLVRVSKPSTHVTIGLVTIWVFQNIVSNQLYSTSVSGLNVIRSVGSSQYIRLAFLTQNLRLAVHLPSILMLVYSLLPCCHSNSTNTVGTTLVTVLQWGIL
jgi:hypothetical protein